MDLEDNEVHARILLAVMAVAETEAKQLQMSVSRPVVRAIGDMVVQYMEVLARELEMFAQHAGRKTVNMDDVLLSARRNPDVAAKLMPLVKELTETSKKDKDEKLRRKKETKEILQKQESEEAADSFPNGESARNVTEKRKRT